MTIDIRIECGWPDHPKTELLARLAGEAAPRCLIRLWCWARKYRPDGSLAGCTEDAIEIAARWMGPRGEFVQRLLEIGWIDRTPEGLVLHEWTVHESWSVGAASRSEAARLAARRRWADHAQACAPHPIRNAERMPSACAPHPIRNAPSPSPPPEEILSPPSQEGGAPSLLPAGQASPLESEPAAAEKAPTTRPDPMTPRSRRPQRRSGDAQVARWDPQIASAIRLFHAAASAHGQTWRLGGDVGRRLAAYFERHGTAETALKALGRLAEKPPRAWYVEEGPWSLSWLAASTDANRQPVDRFQDILEGGMDEKGPSGTTVEDELKRLRGADYKPPAPPAGTEGGRP